MDNKEKINSYINYERDYYFDIFGFKTLEKMYLLSIPKDYKPENIGDSDNNDNNDTDKYRTIIERPQHMYMRVAIAIHGDNIKAGLETYDLLSNQCMIHATPTLFNAGTITQQMSSCFLLHVTDDVDGLYKTVGECAMISKYSGGIGLHIQDIRSANAHIRGTGGVSNGIVPYMRVLNCTARHINQGGKRNGSIAVYIEPWHSDIREFLDTKKPQGSEDTLCRDLFIALFVNDLFMRRVKDDGVWSLMNPDICRGLTEAYGDEFDKLYEYYEQENKYVKQIKARDLWNAILKTQIESGTPYMVYKDQVNKLSNQSNLGTIKSSNLCSEIVQYSDEYETAVCNLASLGLPAFVKDNTFDFVALRNATRVLVTNLNKIIDKNLYVNDKTRLSNTKHRPMAIGIQGLADVFIKLSEQALLSPTSTTEYYPFDSMNARILNKLITEHIYYSAIETSIKLCLIPKTYNSHITIFSPTFFEDVENGLINIEDYIIGSEPYSTFKGSNLSKGLFNFDMWNSINPKMRNTNTNKTDINVNWNYVYESHSSDELLLLSKVNNNDTSLNWNMLRKYVMKYGVKNSLLLGYMPTAGTSQILGYNESFEPITSNIYKRRTLAGEFIIVNKYLVNVLKSQGLWNQDIKNKIIMNDGSVQDIPEIPSRVKEVFKTVWEIKQKCILEMSIDRARYICQSQSLNIYMSDPTYEKLTSMHFYGWDNHLKTGMYYLRTKSKSKSQKFTIDPSYTSTSTSSSSSSTNKTTPKKYTCTDDVCTTCSS
jgi:ribonucleoside-diphosphate reductase alpha chain